MVSPTENIKGKVITDAVAEAAYVLVHNCTAIEMDVHTRQVALGVPEDLRVKFPEKWWEQDSARSGNVKILAHNNSHVRHAFEEMGVKEADLLKAGILASNGTLYYDLKQILAASKIYQQKNADVLKAEEQAVAERFAAAQAKESEVANDETVTLATRTIASKRNNRTWIDRLAPEGGIYNQWVNLRDMGDEAIARGAVATWKVIVNPRQALSVLLSGGNSSLASKAEAAVHDGSAGRN